MELNPTLWHIKRARQPRESSEYTESNRTRRRERETAAVVTFHVRLLKRWRQSQAVSNHVVLTRDCRGKWFSRVRLKFSSTTQLCIVFTVTHTHASTPPDLPSTTTLLWREHWHHLSEGFQPYMQTTKSSVLFCSLKNINWKVHLLTFSGVSIMIN